MLERSQPANTSFAFDLLALSCLWKELTAHSCVYWVVCCDSFAWQFAGAVWNPARIRGLVRQEVLWSPRLDGITAQFSLYVTPCFPPTNINTPPSRVKSSRDHSYSTKSHTNILRLKRAANIGIARCGCWWQCSREFLWFQQVNRMRWTWLDNEAIPGTTAPWSLLSRQA